MTRTASSNAAGKRVAVPCCSCGQPTSMKVPAALLDEIEVLHLCTACVHSTGPLRAPAAAGAELTARRR